MAYKIKNSVSRSSSAGTCIARNGVSTPHHDGRCECSYADDDGLDSLLAPVALLLPRVFQLRLKLYSQSRCTIETLSYRGLESLKPLGPCHIDL